MNNDELFNQILGIIRTVKDNKEELQKILNFLMNEIYEEQEEPEEDIAIPEKYKKLVYNIAQSLSAGLKCFLNPETLEMEEVPNEIDDPEEFELTTGEKWEDSFKHDTWEKCVIIEPPGSNDSFRIMEQFTSQISDEKLKGRLIFALNHRKPFANFKNLIDNSTEREAWFEFRQRKLEEYVWNLLEPVLINNN